MTCVKYKIRNTSPTVARFAKQVRGYDIDFCWDNIRTLIWNVVWEMRDVIVTDVDFPYENINKKN